MRGHLGDERARRIDVRHDVDVPVELPVLIGRGLVAEAQDAGVGAEQIDRAVGALGFPNQVRDISFPGHVAADRQGADVPSQGVERLGLDVGDHHPFRTLAGEAPRQRRADAVGRAGDHRHLAFELHRHGVPKRPRSIASRSSSESV